MTKQMRSMVFLLTTLACVACGPAPEAPDAGSDPVDAARTGDGGARDTGVPVDGGTGECAASEHDCGGVCTADGVNDPATGCRLGCGEACAGGTMAICD